MYDAVVIGGGMSGLAAAIRLAHFNYSVCLLEKHSVLGGLNSFYKYKRHLFDVGLHALTNYSDGSNRNAPLPKLIRQLRLDPEALALAPQKGSAVSFPGIRLSFANDARLLEDEVARLFPREIDGYRKLVAFIRDYDDTALSAVWSSARLELANFLKDPLLTDMLLCPIMFYGSAEEADMDWVQFVTLFKAIFLEGFCRPDGGIRPMIRMLMRRLRECGVNLRLKTGVAALEHDGQSIRGIRLENGEILEARMIFSSAGYLETMKLAGEEIPREDPRLGRLSFMEALSVLDRTAGEAGCGDTIIFYSNALPFQYRRPPGETDTQSGVLCFPDNYLTAHPPRDHLFRITNLANYAAWKRMPREQYAAAKESWFQASLRDAASHLPNFSGKILLTDIFSPLTVEKFTGHLQGAVYGSPRKHRDGRTPFDNLVVCGTDQGYLGVVGAMLSGITMANLHVLSKVG